MPRRFICALEIFTALALATGCSTTQRDLSRGDVRPDAVPAAHSEWPGYYDPNYPYYYTLPENRRRETRPSVAPQPQPPDTPLTPIPSGF